MKYERRERHLAAQSALGASGGGDDRGLVSRHGLDLEPLEERPDRRGRVDLEGGRPGYRSDPLAEFAPGPRMAAAEDDVELDRHARRTPVDALDHMWAHLGVDGIRVTPVALRPRGDGRRITRTFEIGWRDLERRRRALASKGVLQHRSADATVEEQYRVSGPVECQDRDTARRC